MSRQLAVASAFSVFALSAVALLGPATANGSDPIGGTYATGATMDIAAPAFTVELPLID